MQSILVYYHLLTSKVLSLLNNWITESKLMSEKFGTKIDFDISVPFVTWKPSGAK